MMLFAVRLCFEEVELIRPGELPQGFWSQRPGEVSAELRVLIAAIEDHR
jgi:hypothetical protein